MLMSADGIVAWMLFSSANTPLPQESTYFKEWRPELFGDQKAES